MTVRDTKWSEVFVLAMTLIGALSPLPALWQDVSFKTTLGRVLYAVVFLALGLAFLLARAKENAAQRAEDLRRDEGIKGHFDKGLDAFAKNIEQTLTVARQGGPVAAPLVLALDDYASYVRRLFTHRQPGDAAAFMLATGIAGDETGGYVDSPRPLFPQPAVVAPGPAEIVVEGHAPTVTIAPEQVLKEIRDNPPTTPEAVNEAAGRIRSLYPITVGGTATVSATLDLKKLDRDGNITEERDG